MWNNRRRQDELLARLGEQSTILAQLHSEIAELRRQADEQRDNQKRSESTYAARIANLQAHLDECEQQHQDAEAQRLRIEELTNVIRGLERGVKEGGKWRDLPPDDAFWQTSIEPTSPFVVPFSPDMELMLWIGHARFSTLPITSLILPRSYATRSFVRIPESEDGGQRRVTESETDVADMLDGYIALRLGGYAAPPTWVETLLRFKTQPDLNIWLVWFKEDTSATNDASIRIAVACPQHSFNSEPTLPPGWNDKQVIYFERRPSQELVVPLPNTQVVAPDPPGTSPSDDFLQDSLAR